jgi:hypothetical protein
MNSNNENKILENEKIEDENENNLPIIKEEPLIINNEEENNLNEKKEKIEEKKLENESFDNSDNSIFNNIEYNENENDSFFSLNKSKNLFDLDLTQEENKKDIIDINKDILNNSQEYFNDVYNRSNIIKDNDVFSDINN